MARAAAIWTAKAQPKLAAFNVRGTTAGKVVIPATVSDGPGKGRQVDCTIHPNDLDEALKMITKALDARNAETEWREGRKADKPKAKKVPKQQDKSGIDTLRELLTLEPVKAEPRVDKPVRRMKNAPNPEKKLMHCLCGCNLQHFNINGYVYGHKMDPRSVGAR